MALYAQTSGTQETNSASFVPLPGLTLTIPEGVGASALVILNIPMPFAQGNNNPGGTFGVTVNGALPSVVAGFTYNEQMPAGCRPPWSCACRSPTRHRPSQAFGPACAAAR